MLRGSHALKDALADPRTRFVSSDRLLAAGRIAQLRRVLDTEMFAALQLLDRPAPPETIWSMKRDYTETLPKTAKLMTAYLDSRREKAWQVADRIGLIRMLRSQSFVAFAESLAGRKLAAGHGLQVLCYRSGDYSGPHNDHHPENPRARRGYIDVHVSFASPAVAHQYVVYARAGHFSHSVAVAGEGVRPMVSGYRLPFWHYTTPLVARAGREPAARRWVLLGTFLFA